MKRKSKVFKNLLIVLCITGAMIGILFPLLKDYKFGLDLQGGFEVLYEVESVDGKK